MDTTRDLVHLLDSILDTLLPEMHMDTRPPVERRSLQDITPADTTRLLPM